MPLDVLTFAETVERLIALARGDGHAYVVTANVDHLVRFARDPAIRDLYTGADLVVADGMPVIWASRFLGRPLPQRVAGSDLFPALSARAAAENLSIYLLGGAPGAADRAAAILRDRHPSLRVAGTFCPDFGFEKDESECLRIADRVRDARADILFVGLGSPKQEHWIARYRHRAAAKLSIGVGISFSFLCGDVVRAPRWMQRLGLEWLHRLAQEPRRLWKRYLVDDMAFFRLVLRERLRRT